METNHLHAGIVTMLQSDLLQHMDIRVVPVHIMLTVMGFIVWIALGGAVIHMVPMPREETLMTFIAKDSSAYIARVTATTQRNADVCGRDATTVHQH